MLREDRFLGDTCTTGLVRPVTTPEMLQRALYRMDGLAPILKAGEGMNVHDVLQPLADEQLAAEVESHLQSLPRKTAEELAQHRTVAATRALILSNRLALLPVRLHVPAQPPGPTELADGRAPEVGSAASEGDSQVMWNLTVNDRSVYISTSHWALASLGPRTAAECRYYQTVAARINYLYTLQNTLQLYAVDEDGRRLRKKKRHVVRNRSVASLQSGMTPEEYYRLKGAYRGTFTNFDIVEELHVTPPAVNQDASEDSGDSDDDAVLALQGALLREESTLSTMTEDDSDIRRASDDDNVDDMDISAILAQLDDSGPASDPEASVQDTYPLREAGREDESGSASEGEEGNATSTASTGSVPRRTTTYQQQQQRRVRQGRNTFGHSSQNKKKQLRRRHAHNPKARSRPQKRSGETKAATGDERPVDADLHAIRKRRQYSREAYMNKLIKRCIRAHLPLVRRMHALAQEADGALTDAILEADAEFMHCWQTYHVEYEYHPADALHMQWVVTETPGRHDPFAALTAAGYTVPYPAGIDAVYACAVQVEGGTTQRTPLREQFMRFYTEVCEYEWRDGLGLSLWYPTLAAHSAGREMPGPPPLSLHAVFWVTYYNVYQLELAARGRPPGIERDRSTAPYQTRIEAERAGAQWVPPTLRQQAQHVLTAYLPLVCYYRREWATQFARPRAPADGAQQARESARVTDPEVPLDIYEPSEAHLLPAMHSPEIVEYTRHLQHIDFWYPRTAESDIITQVMGKCLPFRSHGRNNTSLGKQTLKKKPVYQVFLTRIARLVFYGLYDLERWDREFLRRQQPLIADEQAKAHKGRGQGRARSRSRRGSEWPVSARELLDPHSDPPYDEVHLAMRQTSSEMRIRKKRRLGYYATRSYRPSLAAMCRMEEEVFATPQQLAKFIFRGSSSLYSTCVCILLTLLLENAPSIERILEKTWRHIIPTFMRIGHMARQFVGAVTRCTPTERIISQLEKDVHALRKEEIELQSFPKDNFVEVLEARLNEIKVLFYAYTYHDAEAIQCLQLVRHHLAHHHGIAPGATQSSAALLAAGVPPAKLPGTLLEDAGKPLRFPPNEHLSDTEVDLLLDVLGPDHVLHLLYQLVRTEVAATGLLPPVSPLFDGPRDVTHYATALIDELYGPLQHGNERNKAARQPIRTRGQRPASRGVSGASSREADLRPTAPPTRPKKRGPVPRNHMVGKKVPVNAVRHMHIARRYVNYKYERNRERLRTLLAPLARALLRAGASLPEAGSAVQLEAGERLVRLLEKDEDRYGWLPRSVARTLLQIVPVDALWDATSLYYRYKRAHLAILQQRPTEEEKRTLWQQFCTVTSDEEADALVRRLIPRSDLVHFKQLVDLYEERASAALLESKISEMQGRTIFLLELVIRMRRQLYQVCTVPLNREDAKKIQHAMEHKRYTVLPTDEGPLETLPLRVYDVYATPCCERVATITSPSSFGHFRIKVDSAKGRYTCDMFREQRRKRNQANKHPDPPLFGLECGIEGGWVQGEGGKWVPLLPEDQNSGTQWLPIWAVGDNRGLTLTRLAALLRGEVAPDDPMTSEYTTVMFHNLDVNSQRQLCRRGKRDAEDVTCEKRPPLYRVNLKHARLFFGTSATKRQAFQFCLRCGSFDPFTDANWTYNGYACRSCRQKMVPAILPARCDHCNKRVKGTEKVAPMVFLKDARKPIKLRHYCVKHQGYHREPYTTLRTHRHQMSRRNAITRYMSGTQTARERQIISRINYRQSNNHRGHC